MEEKQYMSGCQLRQYLHISTRKLKFLMDHKLIPHINTGHATHKYLVLKEDAEKFLVRLGTDQKLIEKLRGQFPHEGDRHPKPFFVASEENCTAFRLWLEKRWAELPDALPTLTAAHSNTTGVGLEFYENEIRQMVAPNVLNMLETLNIDPLGVSTDSLMLIAPPEIVGDIKNAVAKYDVAISEIGEVNNSGEPILIKEDGSNEKLVPLFREAAYTKIKKLVGDTTPEDFEEMKRKVQEASDAAIAKKDKVIKHIREN